MACCANCEHEEQDHGFRGCIVYPCLCPMQYGEKSVNYEDAVANPDRVKAADRQVGGDHYMQAGIQPWEIWKAYGLDPWQAGIIKYILRAGRKENVPALQDYEKARHYLDYLIEREGGQ